MPAKGMGMMTQSSLIDGCLDEFERELALYQKLGFEYTEIGVHGVDAVVGGKLNFRNIKRVKEALKKYNLKATVHSPDILNLRDKENFELHKIVFKSSIEFTSELGEKILVYHLGKAKESMPEEYEDLMREREIDTLKDLAEFAKERGVQICVENNCNESSTEELIQVIKKINRENIGITCDFGHAFVSLHGNEEQFLEFIEKALPFMKHIHIHDNFGTPGLGAEEEFHYRFLFPFGIGDLHLPPGMGKIPYDKIAPMMKKYYGVAMMEVKYRYEELYPSAIDMCKRIFM